MTPYRDRRDAGHYEPTKPTAATSRKAVKPQAKRTTTKKAHTR